MREHIHNMSDDLLVKYLLGQASDPESEQVEKWMTASAANERYFEHLRIIWEASHGLAAKSTVDEEAAWLRFQHRVQTATTTTAVVPFYRNWKMARVAAIVLTTVTVLAILYFFSGIATPDPLTFVTTIESKRDTLSDGSVVTLNKHSSISYPGKFAKANRKVTLKGEAFFNITPDKQKPFIIEVNGLTVKVVGTSFNIRTEGKATEVIVETGIVEVSNGLQTVLLSPHEKIGVPTPDSMLQKEKTGEQLYKYYRNKEFVCDHTPLWKLVQVLNEAYDAHIVIRNDDIKSTPLTTTFHDQPLDEILRIISQTIDITIEHSNTGIIMY